MPAELAKVRGAKFGVAGRFIGQISYSLYLVHSDARFDAPDAGGLMMNIDMEPHIAETLAEVLRERVVELETLEATGAATEDTVGRLAFVRKMLVRFDACLPLAPPLGCQPAKEAA